MNINASRALGAVQEQNPEEASSKPQTADLLSSTRQAGGRPAVAGERLALTRPCKICLHRSLR